jgi:hypothetical protein
LVEPFTLIISWFSNRLKSGFSAFLPDQLGVSFNAFSISGLVTCKYSCSSMIWFASSSKVLPLLCFLSLVFLFFPISALGFQVQAVAALLSLMPG